MQDNVDMVDVEQGHFHGFLNMSESALHLAVEREVFLAVDGHNGLLSSHHHLSVKMDLVCESLLAKIVDYFVYRLEYIVTPPQHTTNP